MTQANYTIHQATTMGGVTASIKQSLAEYNTIEQMIEQCDLRAYVSIVFYDMRQATLVKHNLMTGETIAPYIN